ncbi:hypothetical protein [Kamptonema formosum]|uniref:hypothetical protein n=1 Tax=Kamptonema formosum TaxID=331992 RepID=UPI0003488A74|nr:hypothetical protein [Oscillatoria sp. PCC 10802]
MTGSIIASDGSGFCANFSSYDAGRGCLQVNSRVNLPVNLPVMRVGQSPTRGGCQSKPVGHTDG